MYLISFWVQLHKVAFGWQRHWLLHYYSVLIKRIPEIFYSFLYHERLREPPVHSTIGFSYHNNFFFLFYYDSTECCTVTSQQPIVAQYPSRLSFLHPDSFSLSVQAAGWKCCYLLGQWCLIRSFKFKHVLIPSVLSWHYAACSWEPWGGGFGSWMISELLRRAVRTKLEPHCEPPLLATYFPPSYLVPSYLSSGAFA